MTVIVNAVNVNVCQLDFNIAFVKKPTTNKTTKAIGK